MNPSNMMFQAILADNTINDPGAGGTIRLDRQFGVVELTLVAADEAARVLPDAPRAGIQLSICVKDFTASATADVNGTFLNSSGTNGTKLTFDDAEDFASLISMNIDGTMTWVVQVAKAAIGS